VCGGARPYRKFRKLFCCHSFPLLSLHSYQHFLISQHIATTGTAYFDQALLNEGFETKLIAKDSSCSVRLAQRIFRSFSRLACLPSLPVLYNNRCNESPRYSMPHEPNTQVQHTPLPSSALGSTSSSTLYPTMP
jgi:hypothetical protein